MSTIPPVQAKEPIKRIAVIDPRPDDPTKKMVGLGPPPADGTGPVSPLTDRSIQKDPNVNPNIAKAFTTTIGVALGNNQMLPIELSKEKSEKHQKSLDTAGQTLKTQLEVYLYVADIAHKLSDKDLVTWFRYDPQTRSIVYQIHNEEQEYHVSFKAIQKLHGQNNYDSKLFLDAMTQLDNEFSKIQGITVKLVNYADGHVTLLTGPNPFDKSTDPALKRLAGKSFEQALDVVNQRLQRKGIQTYGDVAENFKDLKTALESQLTYAKEHGQTATAKLLEALLKDIKSMDGFAVGLAAALTIEPKDYAAAVQLRDQIYGVVPAKQYTADILGLYLQSCWTQPDEARLQSMHSELTLSLHASKTHAGTEHALLAYLKTRDLNKLKEFLTQRFPSLGTQDADPVATMIQEICNELDPDEAEDEMP